MLFKYLLAYQFFAFCRYKKWRWRFDDTAKKREQKKIERSENSEAKSGFAFVASVFCCVVIFWVTVRATRIEIGDSFSVLLFLSTVLLLLRHRIQSVVAGASVAGSCARGRAVVAGAAVAWIEFAFNKIRLNTTKTKAKIYAIVRLTVDFVQQK